MAAWPDIKIWQYLFYASLLPLSLYGFLWLKELFCDVEKLPGLSFHAAIKILDVSAVRRKYFFQCKSPDGTEASFFMSASNRFAFSVTDIRKETYSLDVPIGSEGVPMGRYIYLICEAATSSNSSFMRILVDGKEIQRRDFKFPIDMGSRQWSMAVGGDSEGKNNAAFALAEVIILSMSITRKEMKVIYSDLKERVFSHLEK